MTLFLCGSSWVDIYSDSESDVHYAEDVELLNGVPGNLDVLQSFRQQCRYVLDTFYGSLGQDLPQPKPCFCEREVRRSEWVLPFRQINSTRWYRA